ncbi:DNA polymerase III subunit delta' [Desulfuromonas sp. KJ2020]|uniref:DNA polymerase III subunit delta' n=1 Tax=Desulfuromonas sp. KJ2020 TaxID=2919173 RepID=UPI0020A7AE8C|nr:DNA polymerase III subunit delta' [Desulfuromonas sp. KJ2020]MCP3177634.1 DNA polymerase III subunit delta' [Desulfuromonas sp. KJ2020]
MTFGQVLGHNRQKDLLRRAIASGRLAHAYLFHGADGIGKRLMALAFVRAIFCQNGTGCGTCTACRKVDHHNHPDLHILEPDGATIKIEQVRMIQKELSFRPLEALKKICLIDGAEKLNPAAGNALLKTLEEPKGEALLILLSSQKERVLPTIRSRCQQIPFYAVPRAILQQALQEKLGLNESQGHILAALSEGSFKKALGKDKDLFLDQRRELLKALTALSPGSIIALFKLAEEIAGEKERFQEILELFQAFYRDLLLYKQGMPESELVNIDLLEKIQRVAKRESTATLLAKLEAIAVSRRQADRNVNKLLAMEVLLMRLAA